MKQTILIFLPALVAATLPSKWAISTPQLLRDYATIQIEGTTDDESLTAIITTAGTGVKAVAVQQADHKLGLPESAFTGLTGAKQAWLEERGALSTLIIAGSDAGGDWRLALEFHQRHLWLRRLSRAGEGRDSFIWYAHDDLKPSKEHFRSFVGRGLHR